MPSDSPDDFAAFRDLKVKQPFRYVLNRCACVWCTGGGFSYVILGVVLSPLILGIMAMVASFVPPPLLFWGLWLWLRASQLRLYLPCSVPMTTACGPEHKARMVSVVCGGFSHSGQRLKNSVHPVSHFVLLCAVQGEVWHHRRHGAPLRGHPHHQHPRGMVMWTLAEVFFVTLISCSSFELLFAAQSKRTYMPFPSSYSQTS